MILALLLACSGNGADTGSPATDGTPAWCDTAIEVGWDDFGHGFLLTHCQGCHATTTQDRHGAPEAVVFDTEQDAYDRRADILRVVVETGTMPPAGGVTDDEMQLLEAWLSCSY